MKLLALRFQDHDSNFSYYDGKNVKYFSTERYLGIKHHGWGDNPFNNELNSILVAAFGVGVDDVDAISIVTNNYSFGDNLLVRGDVGFKKPTYYVDHHLAHAFSSWPHGVHCKNSFVFDGQGNDFKTHSLFTNGKLIDVFDRYAH